MEPLLQPEFIGPLSGGLVMLAAVVGFFVLRYKKLEIEAQKTQASTDVEVQRELLSELKRMRADQDSMRQELAALKNQGTSDWEAQRQAEQRQRS